MTDKFDRNTFVSKLDLTNKVQEDIARLTEIKNRYFCEKSLGDMHIDHVINEVNLTNRKQLEWLGEQSMDFMNGLTIDKQIDILLNNDLLNCTAEDKSKLSELVSVRKSHKESYDFVKHSDPMVFTHQYILRTFDTKYDVSKHCEYLGLFKKYPQDTEIRDMVIDEVVILIGNEMQDAHWSICKILPKYFGFTFDINFTNRFDMDIEEHEIDRVFELANIVKQLSESEKETENE